MIKRALLKDLKEHLSKKEISLIIGPRQAGKTTLMLLLKEHLEKRGKRTLFFNLDIESDNRFFISQAELIKKIQLEIGKKQGFIFIDEIQRKEDAGLFLKGIYDMGLQYKFIVSGSGSLELKERIHESLTGRKRVFEVSTLSFKEFIDFRTGYRYEGKLSDFFDVEREKVEVLLDEYLNFGGYPRVVLDETIEEKRNTINEIYQSYIEKDISYLLKIKKVEALSNLLRLISSQTGNIVNYSELSSTLGLSHKTIKDYLWYLEKTFILQRINPFYRNIRKEITKSPIYFFYDLGLRNYIIGVFGNIVLPQDKGFIFQNFIFNILKERFGQTSTKINFWRTKDGAEVDFVINRGNLIIPIEVKYKKFKDVELTKSIRSFIEKYRPERAYVINLNLERRIKINSTSVHFLPYYKIFTEKFLS